MASRNYAQVAPTSTTIAYGAFIYGFAGHSMVTPHAALKRLWWTDERIDAKVTRNFVVSKLRGEEREFLDRAPLFGEGLTDDTYMEWILERAKRLFLILAEVGVPDQIFGCIDDSWDDEDLPVSLEDVKNLELSADNNHLLDKKFYDLQFVYLLRELKKGTHIDYGPNEHIPMDHVNTLPPAVTLQAYDRVHFPNRPDDVFMRRKFAFTDRDNGQSYKAQFTKDIRKAKVLSHEHIAHTWGSYTSENAGFMLSNFVAEHTLATFIEHRTPMQFLRVPQQKRPVMLMEWMHCLSDALASLHARGIAHTQIRPSSIWVDHENNIAFADVGSLPTLQRSKKIPRSEAYDYAAPEQQISKSPLSFKSSSPPISSMGAFSRLRKMSTHSVSDTSSSTSGSSGASSVRSNSICTTGASPPTPASTVGRSSSIITIKTNLSHLTPIGDPRSPASMRNFSRLPCPSPTIPTGPLSPTSTLNSNSPFGTTSFIDPDTLRDLPTFSPEMSDVYSLACIFLDIITFILRGKINEFVKFRSTKITTPGKNKVRTDTSFHYEPEKIAAWIDTLEEDSYRHGEDVFRGLPEVLRLVRQMMAQNATYRPTALEVRDRLETILMDESGVKKLCCAGREWPAFNKDDLKDEVDVKSPFRRKASELSLATGMLNLSPPTSRKDRPDSSRRTSSATAGAEQFSPTTLQKTESHVSLASMKTGGRRGSAASTATARLSMWRNKFLRSTA